MNRFLGKLALMGGVAVIGFAPPSQAQGTGSSQSAARADTPNVTHIIVTAQRRQERLEDVPSSIVAVSAETIERAGVVNIQQIGSIAPGVQVNQAGGATQPSIRGITSLTNQVGFENNVALYIDGFYAPDMIALNSDLGNIADVQVLKGPQGTLYGRNATGGAILISTLAPSKTYTGKAEISYGSYDTLTTSAYISGPLTDWLRFGLAGYLRKTDGYLDFAEPTRSGNAAPIKQQSIRSKVQADLASNFTATLGFNYGLSSDPRGNLFTPRDHITPATALLPRATDPMEMSYNYRTANRAKVYEGTLKLEWNTDIGTLTSYSGYARRNSRQDFDTDGTYADIASSENSYREDTYQQTLDYAINAINGLDLVVGASYYNDHTRSTPPLHQTTYGPNRAFSFYVDSDLRTEAFAFYADGTIHLSDALSLSLGGRYSDETKKIEMVGTGALATLLPLTVRRASFDKFTPRASLRYEIAPRTNVYASYSQGFRSGTFPVAVGAPSLVIPVRPETITSYEIGFKTAQSFFRFDAAAFYYRDKDQFISLTSQICTSPTNCTFTSVLGNAPKAKVYGLEAQLSATPIDGLNIRAGASYLHARFGDFPNAVGTGLNTTTNTNVLNQTQDWSNKQLPRAPDFSGNVGIDYEMALAGGTLLTAVNANYTDSFVIQNLSLYGPLAGPELAGKQRYRQKAYTLVNAQITWTDPSEHLYIGAYARNLTDKRYRLTYNGNSRGDYSTPAWPREIGVKVGYRF
ncbi:TonB-dependent receptor [Sphingobium tyrosinilyticum]|uniref:TonB-dependent receptor n=1 Tax=Sphingobium tyrosinilyticum TaxID=2715436 RepID=A0ABV9EZH5_9SPHN